MAKIGRPPRLIAYDTDLNIKLRQDGKASEFRILRPRTMLYGAVIALVGAVMLYALATRTNESINVIHDRNPVFVRLSDGSLRNGYTVRIVNKQLVAREFALDITGLSNLRFEFVGVPASADGRRIIEVGPDQTREVRVLVTSQGASLPHSTDVVFRITDLATGVEAQAVDHFRGP
jgi:polyferredoxin